MISLETMQMLEREWQDRAASFHEQIAALKRENAQLRAALEIARTRGHNIDYWLMEARAAKPQADACAANGTSE
jgi:hypothetical protein